MIESRRIALAHTGLDRQAFEEIADVDREEAGDVPQLGRRNAIGALLVFLNLLEGQAQGAT